MFHLVFLSSYYVLNMAIASLILFLKSLRYEE